MGSTGAMDMANQVAMGNVQLEAALVWHLQGNHYPPVPRSMVAPCMRAIKYANKGEWTKNVRLPEGVLWRGRKTAPVSAFIESYRLEFFLDSDEEEYWEEE